MGIWGKGKKGKRVGEEERAEVEAEYRVVRTLEGEEKRVEGEGEKKKSFQKGPSASDQGLSLYCPSLAPVAEQLWAKQY